MIAKNIGVEAKQSQIDERFSEANTKLKYLEETTGRLEEALLPVLKGHYAQDAADDEAKEGLRVTYSPVGEQIFNIEERINYINNRLNNLLNILAV